MKYIVGTLSYKDSEFTYEVERTDRGIGDVCYVALLWEIQGVKEPVDITEIASDGLESAIREDAHEQWEVLTYGEGSYV
ncbi:MAG: hypothetical protein LAT56_00355 [Wenzhouxiangella sp.]|nr:hypothetical protein [Wenzhouxiangella sp.]